MAINNLPSVDGTQNPWKDEVRPKINEVIDEVNTHKPVDAELTEGSDNAARSGDVFEKIDNINSELGYLKLDFGGSIDVEFNDYYLKSDNSTALYSGGAVTEEYPCIEGDKFIFTGQYGLNAVAAVFLNASREVIGFIDNPPALVSVEDFEIIIPELATFVRFGSTQDVTVLFQGTLVDINDRFDSNDESIESINEDIKYLHDNNILRVDYATNNDYLNVNLESSGNGEIFQHGRIIESGGVVNKLYVNLHTLKDGGLTDFNVRLYSIDATTNKVTNRSSILNIPSIEIKVHEVDVEFTIDYNCRIALGVDAGVSIGYGGEDVFSEGFGYIAGLGSDSISYSIDDVIIPSQEFVTACGFGYDIGLNILVKDKVDKLATLAGLNLCGIGDSMVKGHSLTASDTYIYKIAQRNDMNLVNVGINGNFLSDNGGSGTPMVDRVSDIPNDTDILIVDIGTNDAASSVTIGLEESVDKTEFYGALNVFLEEVVNRIPSARIAFISPYLRSANVQAYVDALKVGCGKYGIPVLDNIKEGLIKWDNAAQYNLLTLQDSYHFNALGHLRNSFKIEGFIKSKL